MKRTNKLIYALAAVIVAIMLITSIIAGGGADYVRAATSAYSNVLDDLRKDANFNVNDFPAHADDYRLYVIQIGEGANGDLFLYTYQPCQSSLPLTATHINMSLTDSVNDTELYDLELINATGVFAKYRVKGVTVRSNTVLRYYNISSIYRAWIEGIDDPPDTDNTINEKAFPVGKLFYVMTQQDGTIVYNLDPTYVVQIIDPVSSYITVENSSMSGNVSLWGSYRKYRYTDMHYVAFSTDWDIDRLVSATVHYFYCPGEFTDNDFLWWDINSWTKYGDPVETNAELECTESYDVEYKNLWTVFTLSKHNYTWDKIYSVDDFCKDVAANTKYDDITLNAVQDKVSGREWVLLFNTTERREERENNAGFIYRKTYFTKVENVRVLRLEFESDGIFYNLGAVSDAVSSPYPEEPDEKDPTFWEWLADLLHVNVKTAKIIFVVVVGLIGLAIALPVLSAIFPVVGQVLLWLVKGIGYGFKYLFIGLWWLICLPFRGIIALIEKIKGE